MTSPHTRLPLGASSATQTTGPPSLVNHALDDTGLKRMRAAVAGRGDALAGWKAARGGKGSVNGAAVGSEIGASTMARG